MIIISTFILVFLLNQQFLNLVSEKFIGNYILLISISLFILGFSSLQIKDNRELKMDLLNADIWIFISFILSFSYLAYPSEIVFKLNLGSFSIWAFIGGAFYLFLIIIKERINV